MYDLQELEAIKRLKYRYLRCIDQKLWGELEDCFTEDATAAYGDGRYSFTGRDAILKFLRDAMGADTFLSSHRVHQPEIDFDGPDRARGVWAMEDKVIETKAGIVIQGSAFYYDEYVKVDGSWKIRHTGYKRIFEEMYSRKDIPSLRLTASAWAPAERPAEGGS